MWRKRNCRNLPTKNTPFSKFPLLFLFFYFCMKLFIFAFFFYICFNELWYRGIFWHHQQIVHGEAISSNVLNSFLAAFLSATVCFHSGIWFKALSASLRLDPFCFKLTLGSCWTVKLFWEQEMRCKKTRTVWGSAILR